MKNSQVNERKSYKTSIDSFKNEEWEENPKTDGVVGSTKHEQKKMGCREEGIIKIGKRR